MRNSTPLLCIVLSLFLISSAQAEGFRQTLLGPFHWHDQLRQQNNFNKVASHITLPQKQTDTDDLLRNTTYTDSWFTQSYNQGFALFQSLPQIPSFNKTQSYIASNWDWLYQSSKSLASHLYHNKIVYGSLLIGGVAIYYYIPARIQPAPDIPVALPVTEGALGGVEEVPIAAEVSVIMPFARGAGVVTEPVAETAPILNRALTFPQALSSAIPSTTPDHVVSQVNTPEIRAQVGQLSFDSISLGLSTYHDSEPPLLPRALSVPEDLLRHAQNIISYTTPQRAVSAVGTPPMGAQEQAEQLTDDIMLRLSRQTD